MSLTIMRRIKFCAGHRLHRHGGKCEFFHGHNYVADFYVTGDEVDDVGRVIDFADLKRLFKGWLDEHWDHGFVLNEADENGIAAIKKVEPCKYYRAAVQSDGREHGASTCSTKSARSCWPTRASRRPKSSSGKRMSRSPKLRSTASDDAVTRVAGVERTASPQ